jgi:hypothetical protein
MNKVASIFLTCLLKWLNVAAAGETIRITTGDFVRLIAHLLCLPVGLALIVFY